MLIFDYILIAILLGLLAIPFASLISDAFGITRLATVFSAPICGCLSILIAWVAGGFHQRPSIANLYLVAFFLWPVLLLAAKNKNSSLSWLWAFATVPTMSWYLVNVSMQFDYPTNGGGGGYGYWFCLLFAWTFMVIPFGVVFLLYVSFGMMFRALRSRP
jgi:hypothetical protein